MNWKEIKEVYPKAVKALVEWYKDYHLEVNKENKLGFLLADGIYKEWINFNERDLYDFFDENKIFVEVLMEVDLVNDFTKVDCYYVDIFDENGVDFKVLDDSLYENRKQAETAAFTKCFEILESKL